MRSTRRKKLLALLLSCGGPDISDDDGPGLDDFLPEVPEPTGAPQSTWAGVMSHHLATSSIPASVRYPSSAIAI